MQIVILGGGYAGLSVAAEIKKQNPRATVILIDKKTYFTKKTHLHKTVSQPIENFRVPYEELAEKLGFRFINDEIYFDTATLARFNQDRGLLTSEGAIHFDSLLIATGAAPHTPVAGNGINIWDLSHVAQQSLAQKIEQLPSNCYLTICGAGSTGLQFLGEIASAYRKKFRLRLINFAEIILDEWPLEFHRYVMDKLNYWNVEYHPVTALEKIQGEKLLLRNRANQAILELDSQLTLLFTGVASHPERIYADTFGRVLYEGEPLEAVFTAGDCSYFDTGLNTLTAQAAVRKAKTVAHNLIRRSQPPLRRYLFNVLGYFISLGPGDAIGYVLHENLRVKGLPAWLMKETIELQFDLYLNGVDTFLL